MKYVTIEQIANHFKISVKSARNKLSRIGIKKVKTVNRKAFYLFNDLHQLKKDETKYYPLKTTIIYHIYESKMNYL